MKTQVFVGYDSPEEVTEYLSILVGNLIAQSRQQVIARESCLKNPGLNIGAVIKSAVSER